MAKPAKPRSNYYKDWPARPEHSPHKYEWLPDTYSRDVEPLGPKAREQVRLALAEGKIKALLRTYPTGQRIPIPARMWDKEPLDRKVHPYFKHGRMRMRVAPWGGPYAKGWVFVPLRSLAGEVGRPGNTTGAQKLCEAWLTRLMRAGSKIKSKAEYYEEAKQLYGNGFAKRQFNFAWANAIAKSGNPHVWDKRGPVPQ